MKRILIDTNIYALAMRGDGNVVSILRKIDLIAFAAISVGELYTGSPFIISDKTDTITGDQPLTHLNKVPPAAA